MPFDPRLLQLVLQQNAQQRENELANQNQNLALSLHLVDQGAAPEDLDKAGIDLSGPGGNLLPQVKAYASQMQLQRARQQALGNIPSLVRAGTPPINPSGQGFQPVTPEASAGFQAGVNQLQTVLPQSQRAGALNTLAAGISAAKATQQEEVAKEQRAEATAGREEVQKEKLEEKGAAFKESLAERQLTYGAQVQEAYKNVGGFADRLLAAERGDSGENPQQIRAQAAALFPPAVRTQALMAVDNAYLSELGSDKDGLRATYKYGLDSGIPDLTWQDAVRVNQKKAVYTPFGTVQGDKQTQDEMQDMTAAATAMKQMRDLMGQIAARGGVPLGERNELIQRGLRLANSQDPLVGEYMVQQTIANDALARALTRRVSLPVLTRLQDQLAGLQDMGPTPDGRISPQASARFAGAVNSLATQAGAMANNQKIAERIRQSFSQGSPITVGPTPAPPGSAMGDRAQQLTGALLQKASQ